jgi:pyrroline-5-carboxylate reductase
MTIGFIGTGGIATILVNGFISQDNTMEVIVSPRNADRAKHLKEKYPLNVIIAKNNQEVIDRSDYIFLCVKLEAAEEAIKSLVFNEKNKVFNLVAGLTLESLRNWIGDVELLVHIIPLSFAALGFGPIVLYPDVHEAKKFLNKIGEVFSVDSYEDIRILQALTSVQASFYTLLNSLVDWSIAQGLSPDFATAYTSSLFMAFTKVLQGVDREGLFHLSNEMTPKGINWMIKTRLDDEKAIDAWAKSLTLALERLTLDKT